jgi:hypothetical protein
VADDDVAAAPLVPVDVEVVDIVAMLPEGEGDVADVGLAKWSLDHIKHNTSTQMSLSSLNGSVYESHR